MSHAESPGSFEVRRMDRDQLDLLMDWAAAEGWNPGLYDAAAFFAADPNGFFLGVRDGQPIGGAAAVIYDNHFAFFGLYIVRPEFRHQGFGIQITQARLAYVGNRCAGLDGVVSMQSRYARLGFVLTGQNARYTRVAQSGATPSGLVDLRTVDRADLVAYDARMFSAPRRAFLEQWIHQPESVALGVLENGRLAGYGVVRRCVVGYKIAPLFARTAEMAEQLFAGLSAQVEGESIFLDIPRSNPQALALVERHGMQMVFETGRMYRNGSPPIPLSEVYGITSYELG